LAETIDGIATRRLGSGKHHDDAIGLCGKSLPPHAVIGIGLALHRQCAEIE
jgi:hypothetical protein